MKIDSKIVMLLAMLLAFAARLVHGQGTLIVQHSGDNNPTSEGFTFNESGLTGPITNDLGVNAWSVVSANIIPWYNYSFTPQQQSNIEHSNWILSVTLKIVNPGSQTFKTTLATGTGLFNLWFGSEPDGDPEVNVGDSGYFILTNAGSTYNNYQLMYDAETEEASFWINGTEMADNISGGSVSGNGHLSWGAVQQPNIQANWNLVSLETIPEPSAWSLIVLDSGILICVRRVFRRGGTSIDTDGLKE